MQRCSSRSPSSSSKAKQARSNKELGILLNQLVRGRQQRVQTPTAGQHTRLGQMERQQGRASTTLGSEVGVKGHRR